MDWQPLAETDPVPGDPSAVLELGGRYARAAEEVGAQVAELRRVGHGVGSGLSWDGEAAEAFTARVGQLPHELDAVGRRLQRIAQALREFGPALEAAQRRARAALEHAKAARPAASHPPSADLAAGFNLSLVPPASPDLVRARAMLAAACEERDRAARRCARALAAAGHDELRNPSGWHRFLRGVSAWAGHLSAWLGVAAVVLCWVPGLGELLGAATLTLGLVKLGADLALAGYGERGWGTIAADAFGVVPLGKAARLGAVMSREAAVARAVARAGSRSRLPAARGRSMLALAAPMRFERSRGLHGLDELARLRPSGNVAAARRELVASVQVGIGTRSPADFLRSPGGLLDDIARARSRGTGGPVWLAGGHGLDSIQASVGLRPTPQPSGVS